MRRALRSRLALVATTGIMAALATVGTSGPVHAAGAQCSSSNESRQPVLLVHGFNSGPETWKPATRDKYASVGGTCIDVFDYKNWSTNWVTDPNIGPRLASRIDQLAAASAAGHGSGKVIVVAHSMGGLATRCALAPGCNGGKRTTATHLLELITFGTPHLGTWQRGNGLGYGLEGGLGSFLSGACYAYGVDSTALCVQIRALFTSAATKAFKPGSDQLNALPPVPADIPVFAVAAHVEVVTSLFGHARVDVGDGGDLIVDEVSALQDTHRRGTLGGELTIACGSFNALKLSGENCNHITETNDKRFTEAARKQIEAAVKQFPAKPRPTPTTPPSVPHATAPAPPPPADAYAPGSSFDDYCYNAWPTAPSYTSTSIQMTMSCAHVPQSKYLLTQVVYGDPNLNVTPSTGQMHVVGTVVDAARSAYGYTILQVQASKIIL